MTTVARFVIALSTLAGCSHTEVADGQTPREESTRELADASPLDAIYMLKQLGPDQYAVDMTGGMSDLESGTMTFGLPEPEARPVVRTLSGRVVDNQGRGVAGAVVIGGTRLSMYISSSLSGSHGTTTDGEGRFQLPVTTDEDLTVVAMANETAWSPLTIFAAGKGDGELELRLGEPASVSGHVTRGGEATGAAVYVTSPSEAYNIRFFSEDDGSYESPPLPPGAYEVAFTAGTDLSPSVGIRRAKNVQLGGDADETLDMDLPVGIALTGALEGFDGDARLRTVSFTLVHGTYEPADPAALKALCKGDAAPESRYLLQGGTNLYDDRVFADVMPGAYTLCVEARGAEDPEEPGDDLLLDFQCRTVDIDGGKAAEQLRFSMNAGNGASKGR